MSDKMSDWHGLYNESWKGEIVDEAFSHPAKFARGLIRRIYEHAVEEGWLQSGDTVVDPFGGVALGAIDAMRHGLNWAGVELEPKFVDLGSQNIDLWMQRYAPHFPGWGTARLLQGDSRELASAIESAGGCVSSPPYAETRFDGGLGAREKGYGNFAPYSGERADTWRTQRNQSNLGNLPATADGFDAAISSPPYADSMDKPNGIDTDKIKKPGGPHSQSRLDPRYSASISSPPFEDSLDRGVVDKEMRRQWAREHGISNAEHVSPIDLDKHRDQEYGSTPGQLGAMRADGFDAALSSPPYEGSMTAGGHLVWQGQGRIGAHKDSKGKDEIYGNTAGNIGNQNGADFWTAARKIVEQTYAVLRPGAHAIWVVKAFVKNKERVDFPGQWLRLCEAVGFEMVHYHRAWVVEDRGAQYGLFGELHERKVERKSFFRRLAEKNGSPRIDWEVVLCMVKP